MQSSEKKKVVKKTKKMVSSAMKALLLLFCALGLFFCDRCHVYVRNKKSFFFFFLRLRVCLGPSHGSGIFFPTKKKNSEFTKIHKTSQISRKFANVRGNSSSGIMYFSYNKRLRL